MNKRKILKLISFIFIVASLAFIFSVKTINADTPILVTGDGVITGEVTVYWYDFYDKYQKRPDTVTITLQDQGIEYEEGEDYNSISFTVSLDDAKETYDSNGFTYWVIDYEINPEWLNKSSISADTLPNLYVVDVTFDNEDGLYIEDANIDLYGQRPAESVTYDSENGYVICNFNIYPTFEYMYEMNITVNFDDGDYRDYFRNLTFELDYEPTNGTYSSGDMFWSYYEYDSDFFDSLESTDNSYTFSIGTDYKIYRYDIDSTADSFGDIINYTMTEVIIEDDNHNNLITSGEYTYEYSFDDNGDLTINISHTPKTVSKTVSVVWDDGNDTNELRPSSITVNAIDTNGNTDATFTISSDDDWEKIQSFYKNLKYSGGEEISYYTLEVEDVENYTFDVSYSSSTGYTITGEFVKLLPDEKEEYKDIDITVIFDDDNNRDNTRNAFTFRLMSTNAVKTVAYDFNFTSYDFTASANTFKFTNNTILQYISYWADPNFGELVEYYGYFSSASSTATYSWSFDDDGNLIIYVSSNASTISTNISVDWEDEDDVNQARPDSITVYALNQNNEIENTLTVDSTEDWSNIVELFENLEWSSGKTAVEYTLQVADIENYEFTVSGDIDTGFSITGTYVEDVQEPSTGDEEPAEEVEEEEPEPVEENEDEEEIVEENDEEETIIIDSVEAEEIVQTTDETTNEITETENPGTSDNFNIYFVAISFVIGFLGTIIIAILIKNELKNSFI